MKANEIVNLSDEELDKKLKELKSELSIFASATQAVSLKTRCR